MAWANIGIVCKADTTKDVHESLKFVPQEATINIEE